MNEVGPINLTKSTMQHLDKFEVLFFAESHTLSLQQESPPSEDLKPLPFSQPHLQLLALLGPEQQVSDQPPACLPIYLCPLSVWLCPFLARFSTILAATVTTHL